MPVGTTPLNSGMQIRNVKKNFRNCLAWDCFLALKSAANAHIEPLKLHGALFAKRPQNPR
ncbi:MAG: hypothetical protein DWI25_08695 [Planctomycetota bacterium]|nr:MAG: hypothetical protein DWI25_08695 [Planctomycetota bacterium]